MCKGGYNLSSGQEKKLTKHVADLSRDELDAYLSHINAREQLLEDALGEVPIDKEFEIPEIDPSKFSPEQKRAYTIFMRKFAGQESIPHGVLRPILPQFPAKVQRQLIERYLPHISLRELRDLGVIDANRAQKLKEEAVKSYLKNVRVSPSHLEDELLEVDMEAIWNNVRIPTHKLSEAENHKLLSEYGLPQLTQEFNTMVEKIRAVESNTESQMTHQEFIVQARRHPHIS